MRKCKDTKRALLISVLSVALCLAMLVGTTFAWFTDVARTGYSTLTSGRLDIVLQYKDGETWKSAEGKTLNFVKAADAAEDEELLWEPGCTYYLPEVRVINNGTLAVKYEYDTSKFVFTGDTKLLDALEFVGEAEGDDAESPAILLPGEYSHALKIGFHMKETAGNEYQGLTLTGAKIAVVATQATSESDSFDNQYDKDAKYTEIIADGKTFTGTATLYTGITATAPGAIAVKADGADANVTIKDGTFDGGKGGDNQCVHVQNGATVTILGGTFTVGGDANGYGNSVIESYDGNIIIEGGFFYTDYSYGGKYYVLNQNNSHPGTITVKGGTFVNYDPSTGDDNLGGNFVADGYKVVSEAHGNDTWYTVVKD